MDEPTDFTEIYRADVPTYVNHWNYNADPEVRLDEPARTLFVRYVGDPAVNNLRIYAHCIDDEPRVGGPVVITHLRREGDERKTHQVTLDGPGSYEVVAGAEPVDESIELSVPSD